MGLEDDPAALELKALLCADCYRALVGWISGQSSMPYTPCATCAPVSQSWLEQRQLKSRD